MSEVRSGARWSVRKCSLPSQAVCDVWQGVLNTDVIPVPEVLAGPVRTATSVIVRFACALKGFMEGYTEEEMPRLFTDVSHAFISYASLAISATEQATLKEWGLVDDAMVAWATSGKSSVLSG